MEVNKVVTSFLLFDGKILILKRSEKVKAHQQMWAGISGYLEKREVPFWGAIREIKEETGLSEDNLNLIIASEPLAIPDHEIDILWIVYPHLFKTHNKEIKIDWEHSEYRWINPETISNYVTVPALNETLQMVLPTPLEKITSSREVIRRVKMIEKDKIHSASRLAREALEIVLQASRAYKFGTLEDYLYRIKSLSVLLMNLRPSMGAINYRVGYLLSRIVEKSKIASNLDDLKMFVIKEIEIFNKISENNSIFVSENVQKVITDRARILTHSYSSTVIEAIKLAHNREKNIQVFVSESRPLFEGRNTAKELSKYGIPTTLVTDAAAGFFAGSVDIILLGADSLLADGGVINKAGTYPIVLAAAYHGIPIYVAADIGKLNLRSYFTKILLEEKEAEEIWPNAPANISIRNLYFDITPKFFITGVITERQEIRPEELLEISRELIKDRYIV